MQFLLWICPIGSGNQGLLVIVLRVSVTSNNLEEMTEFYQNFGILRLQTERPQIARFRLGEAPRLLMHVTALEKEKDVDIRLHGVQRAVVKFGGH